MHLLGNQLDNHLVNLLADLHQNVHLATTLNTALVDWLLIQQNAVVCNAVLVHITLSLEV